MRWGASWVAAALAAAVVVWGTPAQADPESCKEFRQQLIQMQAQSVRPPGWFELLQHLRARYQSHCIDDPRRARAVEYWYYEDGTSTGVEVGKGAPRLPQYAYATTKEIGDACLSAAGPMIPGPRGKMIRANLDPSICALDRGAIEACANPIDGQQRSWCTSILGSEAELAKIPKGESLPYVAGLDGAPVQLPVVCQLLLGQLTHNYGLDSNRRGKDVARMKEQCPDFLSAVERRLGLRSDNLDAFWPAFEQFVFQGFPTRQQQAQQPANAAALLANPQYDAMCKAAARNRDKCDLNLKNIASHDATKTGDRGQAGAFAECSALYGSVVAMCGTTDSRLKQMAARQPPSPQPPAQPKPQPQAAAHPPVKPADGSGHSRPPAPAAPPSLAGMSGACKTQLNQLLEASDRRDGARATAAYESLRANCDAGMRGVAGEVNMAMPERQMGTLSRNSFGRCLNSGDCGTAPSTPQQTAQAAASAFNVDEVLNFAFAAAGLAAGVAGFYAPSPGGAIVNSGQFSTINQRARSTYGQGGPTHVAPRQPQSDITGKDLAPRTR